MVLVMVSHINQIKESSSEFKFSKKNSASENHPVLRKLAGLESMVNC